MAVLAGGRELISGLRLSAVPEGVGGTDFVQGSPLPRRGTSDMGGGDRGGLTKPVGEAGFSVTAGQPDKTLQLA